MQPSVTLITGTHITAADKRTILDGIEYLRSTFAKFVEASPETVPPYGDQWIKRGRSKKSYSIAPCPDAVNSYRVIVREVYTNDYGARREQDCTVTVSIKGKPPLHLPEWQACTSPAQMEAAL